MADLYISHSGDDQLGNGLVGNPYRTIQKAYDNLSADEMALVVNDETYDFGILKGPYTPNHGSFGGAGNLTFTDATNSPFAAGNVGKNIYDGSDCYLIDSFISASQVTCTATPGAGPLIIYSVVDQPQVTLALDNANGSNASGEWVGIKSAVSSSPATLDMSGAGASFGLLSIDDECNRFQDFIITGDETSSTQTFLTSTAGSWYGLHLENLTGSGVAQFISGNNLRNFAFVNLDIDGSSHNHGAATVFGIYISGSHGGVVLNCRVHDYVADITKASGIKINGISYGISVIGNLVYNISNGYSIYLDGDGCSSINNTTNGGLAGLYVGSARGTNVALNNIITDATYGIARWAATENTPIVCDYNCLFGNDNNYYLTSAGDNSITTDPLFADSANDDYTLLTGSPCNNTGLATLDSGYRSMGYWDGQAYIALATTPTLTVTAGTNAVTATIDGDAGVTNYLLYKATSDTDWQAGGNRSGDGDITVSGLTNNVPYIFVAYSLDAEGVVSLPSPAVTVSMAATADNDFDDDLADSASDFLSAFGESVTYNPRGGGSRAITAVVDRDDAEKLGAAPHGSSPRTTVSVANSVTTGISAAELDTGGDTITLSVRLGETAIAWRITKLLSSDTGMLQLEVR